MKLDVDTGFTSDLKNRASILLTATVDPCGMHDSPFTPSVREEQYIDALNFYADKYHDFNSIIFAENSGWDLSKIKNSVNNRTKIYFFSFNQNNYPRNYGKGYGELKLIHDTLDSSQISSSTVFIKITGRLKVLNLDLILDQFTESTQLMCDTRSIRVRFWNNHHQPIHTDSRLIMFTRDFFNQHLGNQLDRINESKGVYLENVLHEIVEACRGDRSVIRRFNTEPNILGYGAHMGGKNYHATHLRIKASIRQLFRKLFPNFEL